MRIGSGFAIGLLAAASLAGCMTIPGGKHADANWVGAWGASQSLPLADSKSLDNQTVRLIVHPSLGGDAVRVRVCNTFGAKPLVLGAAAIGIQTNGASLAADSNRTLTFSGKPTIAIPPGAVAVSDPVQLGVSSAQSLAVSLFVAKDTGPVSAHALGMQTSYVSSSGDFAANAAGTAFGTTIQTWPFVCGVDVSAARHARTIVTFGDSITDGFKSTVDANRRWPDVLAARLSAAKQDLAVVNAGISGNRVLHDATAPRVAFGPNALSRFDRDVLTVNGATHVVVLIGINDIGMGTAARNPDEAVSAEELIAGLTQIAARGRARGLTMIGATLTPFAGAAYATEEGEKKRQAVNAWLRDSKVFDACIDFDAATRDPAKPTQFLPAYDSGDHLHPNDAGYRAMGEAVPLALFGP
jgi:lysophospholipase L1-like esterase